GHPRTKAVPTLTPAHVGLVSPLHESKERERSPERVASGAQFTGASVHRVVHTRTCWNCDEIHRSDTRRPQVWRAVWNQGNPCKIPIFHPQFPPVVGLWTRCYARAPATPKGSGPSGVERQIEL